MLLPRRLPQQEPVSAGGGELEGLDEGMGCLAWARVLAMPLVMLACDSTLWASVSPSVK